MQEKTSLWKAFSELDYIHLERNWKYQLDDSGKGRRVIMVKIEFSSCKMNGMEFLVLILTRILKRVVSSNFVRESDRPIQDRETKVKHGKFVLTRLKLRQALKSKLNDSIGKCDSEQDNWKELLVACKHAYIDLMTILSDEGPLKSTLKVQFKTISERCARSLKRLKAKKNFGSVVSPNATPCSSSHVTSLDD